MSSPNQKSHKDEDALIRDVNKPTEATICKKMLPPSTANNGSR